MNAQEILKYNSIFTKFSQLDNAINHVKERPRVQRILLGCDGLFWVCSPKFAKVLNIAGYEYAD